MSLNFKRNKRGAFVEIIILVIFMFVIGMIWGITLFVQKEINDDLLADPLLNSEAKGILTQQSEQLPKNLDGLFLTLLLGLTLAMVVSSFFTDSHPIFFAIAIILNLGFLISAGLMSNAYEETINADPDLAASTPLYPKMHWVMLNWPIVVLLQAFLVSITLYGKSQFG